jgi:hypothetical protein
MSEGPNVTQPRIPRTHLAKLDAAGLSASCYQPVHLFPKDGRKLPNCAEASDPWQVFLRRDTGAFGVVAEGVGATLESAIDAALATAQPQGLLGLLGRLAGEIHLLSARIAHARQD